MTGKTILILGGGVGGLATANELRRRLGQEHKIILVEKNKDHISASSSLWVMVGWRRPEDIKKDTSRLIEKGIELVNAEILKIDPENKVVKTGKGELNYDYLVISLGAALFPETIPGLVDAFGKNAYNLYDLDGVVRLRDTLTNFSGGDIVILICSLPYKCPAAPYETTLLVSDFFKKKNIRKNIKITIITPEVLPMPVAGPAVGNMMKELLERMGIEHNFEHKVESVNAEKNEITHNKGKANYDLLLVVPPHKAPKVVKESGLTDNDWIPVDKDNFKTKFENVYAIGDVAKIKIPGEWKPGVPLMLPKAGVFAHYHAKVVAENIANEISGKGERVGFTGEGACFIEIGRGMAGFGTGNFYAQPNPAVKIKRPSPVWHVSKVLFEKYWLSDVDSFLKKPLDAVLEKMMYGDYKKKASGEVKDAGG
ncbi:MAG: NAD(P)/FAD-dependent oxidoreductase [Nitrospirae bacterium]|nr:NAD(P)/FAD-dependent oxidoreductase [Nitrospirota bacterium]